MKIASRQDLAQAFSSHVIREGPIDEKYKGIAAIFSFQQITQTNRQWVSREQMWPAQLPQQPSHGCRRLVEVNHTG